MSTADTIRFDDKSKAMVDEREASTISFIDSIFYPERIAFITSEGESSSDFSSIRFYKPSELTVRVLEETDAGVDIVRFESIKDLLDDLDA